MEGLVGTVFIVDDAREVRMGLSRVLGAAGYPVRSFESAGLFLDQQDDETPGCLLLDVCMPGLSGRHRNQRARHEGRGCRLSDEANRS